MQLLACVYNNSVRVEKSVAAVLREFGNRPS